MRVVVLGADGMAGHAIVRHFGQRHDVCGTARTGDRHLATQLGIGRNALISGIDVRDISVLAEQLLSLRPDAVINCVGIVKQRPSDAVELLEVNALFPHRLAAVLRDSPARMVHLSTDCVFSGRRGRYSESDLPDPVDLYGVSKLAGEVAQPGTVTIRTSIIGLELTRRGSLVEWFLSQQGEIKGFQRAIFSGLITKELARLIESLVTEHRHVDGLWHVASTPISKFDLLQKLAERTGHPVRITPDSDFACDRSLDGAAFRDVTGYVSPSWDEMIDELVDEIELRNAE